MEYINIDYLKKVDIKIGEITEVFLIENSEKLLRLSVDFGEHGKRTILSGIRKFFPNEGDLVGVKCPFVFNLEPREMMGLKSEGMILACGDGENFSLMKVDQKIVNGTSIK
jgi:methionyl-tRNA synthetase